MVKIHLKYEWRVGTFILGAMKATTEINLKNRRKNDFFN